MIDPVDELRAEMLAQLVHQSAAVIIARRTEHPVGANIRGQDDDTVFERDLAPLGVLETAFIEYRQEDVENLRMSLFDLVEQQHRLRRSPHRFAQEAFFFAASVAGRRA
jgi:hypothetical protein